MSRQKRIHEHYEHRIHPARQSFDVLDWASRQSQTRRFEVLVEHVELAGKSLLDVGCGLGDLWGFLKDRDLDVDYTGVDLLAKMVDEAARRHGDGRFQVRNIFQADRVELPEFDVVFASGTFNLNLGNNLEFLAAALPRMRALARQCVVFNLLHARQVFEPERYFYSDPAEIVEMLTPAGWPVRIIDDYLPNDYTVICTRPEAAETTY